MPSHTVLPAPRRPQATFAIPGRTSTPEVARTVCAALLLVTALVALATRAEAAPGAEVTAKAGAAGAAFATSFRQAAARGDAAALADQAALPFLFEGRRLGRNAFITEVVPALFTPAVRRCLGDSRTGPAAEDGRLVLWCASHGFYLGNSTGQWRFEEFAADSGQ